MSIFEDSCGPAGCPVEWLISDTLEVDPDPEVFNAYALEQGWSDGYPVVPPTSARVRRYIEASGARPSAVLGVLPPTSTVCTVENAAVNAVLAGARPEAMPLICQAVQLLAEEDMAMMGAATTTNAAAPVIMLNGELRDRLAIPYQAGCMGGTATAGTAIGRALRLIMRNVGGERIGTSSKSVFGQPARVTGPVFGEWEERSPWAPFSVRQGAGSDAISGFVTTGTEDVVDITSVNGTELAQMLGRSLAYPAQAIVISQAGGELLLCLCPSWAAMLGSTFPDVQDLQQSLWEHAVIPRSFFPDRYSDQLEGRGLFDKRGDVLVVPEPRNIHVAVCGGMANLHATLFRGFGPHQVITRPLTLLPWKHTEPAHAG
ncbi:MAG: hypothetical protein JO337_11460 [Acidimicrobiales bacterium]|nr:hypothetical protein [Acidimicrobiales bacterium]